MKTHVYITPLLMLAPSAAIAQDAQTLPGVMAQVAAPESISKGCSMHRLRYLTSSDVAEGLGRAPSAETDKLRDDANKEARQACRQGSTNVQFTFIRGADPRQVAIVTGGP